MAKYIQKIYCYVDETGQDAGSEVFVVAAVISYGEQDKLRGQLEAMERLTKILKRKWYRSAYQQRLDFLTCFLESGFKFGHIFYAVYKKPIRFFLPWVEIITLSLAGSINGGYKARVYVDGIDGKKAIELTNALRARGVRLSFVKSVRDETESFIRLADRMAGLVRAAKEQEGVFLKFLNQAKSSGIVSEIKTTPN